jgi:DNA-binding transcriptional LysR family regulator
MKNHKYGAKADDILLFTYVVEAGSFSKVAEEMELSNSVVSKRIARLEQALNAQLLYRSTRKLSLTDAGVVLYQKSRQAKLAIQEAEDAVTGYGDKIRGNIKITMPVVSARFILNDTISKFCAKYPDVSVELSAENRCVDIIKEGFDLAIRTAHLEDSSLIARRLIDSQWIICASPLYIDQHGKPERPEDLSDHDCLVYKYEGAGLDHWALKRDQQDLQIHVKGTMTGNELEALKQAALNGLGVAYLPRVLIHEELLSGDLISVMDEHVGKRLGIYAVYPRTRLPDLRIKLLVEFIRDALVSKREYFY